jgi:hypothetical protein
MTVTYILDHVRNADVVRQKASRTECKFGVPDNNNTIYNVYHISIAYLVLCLTTRLLFKMQNDAGVNIDLYIPRKW